MGMELRESGSVRAVQKARSRSEEMKEWRSFALSNEVVRMKREEFIPKKLKFRCHSMLIRYIDSIQAFKKPQTPPSLVHTMRDNNAP